MKTKFIVLTLVALFFSNCNTDNKVQKENETITEKIEIDLCDDSSFPYKNRMVTLEVPFIHFDNLEKKGKIVVLDVVADEVSAIFKELLEIKFPFEEISPISKYDCNDSLSMFKNNTSSYNYRLKLDGKDFSLHSFGTAIDINPKQNPFLDIACDEQVSNIGLLPINSREYINRNENRMGKDKRRGMAEEVITIFRKHGFYYWGGDWNCPIDYQHFQLSRSSSELLVVLDKEKGTKFFNALKNYFNTNSLKFEKYIDSKLEEQNKTWEDIAKMSDDEFNNLINY